MASAFLANRVRVATATSGVGTVTLGAKTSNKYATFAEGGITDAQVVTYTIEDGDDWEVGRGTYTSAGTTLSRDTVLISSVAGVVGTSKLNLSGAAEVFITAAKEDLDVNDFTEDTTPDGTADFHWMHDASAVLKKKVKPQNLTQAGGMQLLASGTVTNAATLDIVLTAYTAYRGLEFVLQLIPATDAVSLLCRFSTDGGVSYDAGASDYDYRSFSLTSVAVNTISTGATSLVLSTVDSIGNAASEGWKGRVALPNQANAALRPTADWQAIFLDSNAAQRSIPILGSGSRLGVAQDTDAIRFLFSSGNIASGNWAVYGYA